MTSSPCVSIYRKYQNGGLEHKSRHVETGCNNNSWTERDSNATPTATRPFPTTPDLDMALPTLPNIGWHRKLKCRPRNRKWKSEVEITFERKTDGKAIPTATPTFSAMPNLDMSLPTWPDMARHRPTSETQMSLHHLFPFKSYFHFRFPLPFLWPTFEFPMSGEVGQCRQCHIRVLHGQKWGDSR